MYSALACMVLPPLPIYFHAHPVSGQTLEQVTESSFASLQFTMVTPRPPYVIAEDHPSIRLEPLLTSDRIHFNTPSAGSPASTQDRTDRAVLLHSTALPSLDYFYRTGALQVWPSFAGVANYQIITSSAGQHSS